MAQRRGRDRGARERVRLIHIAQQFRTLSTRIDPTLGLLLGEPENSRRRLLCLAVPLCFLNHEDREAARVIHANANIIRRLLMSFDTDSTRPCHHLLGKSMRKLIDMFVDEGSFTSPVPKKLINIRSVNLQLLLLHTAIWTRPPLVSGFDLSDTWAWLRYARAFDDGPDLRLREEWRDVDPHQKTIFSDEVGVGTSTLALSRGLGLVGYLDTKYFLKMIAPASWHEQMSRNGDTKTPDYVSLDKNGKLHIIECKGSQDSISYLKSAINTGLKQKKSLQKHINITSTGLVCGVFVPQFANSARARIIVRDPPNKLRSVLRAVPPHRVRATIIRGIIAKQLSISGALFAAKQIFLEQALSPSSLKEMELLTSNKTIFRQSALSERYISDALTKLSIKMSPGTFAFLEQNGTSDEALNSLPMQPWTHEVRHVNRSILTTPHGFSFDLYYRIRGKSASLALPTTENNMRRTRLPD